MFIMEYSGRKNDGIIVFIRLGYGSAEPINYTGEKRASFMVGEAYDEWSDYRQLI